MQNDRTENQAHTVGLRTGAFAGGRVCSEIDPIPVSDSEVLSMVLGAAAYRSDRIIAPTNKGIVALSEVKNPVGHGERSFASLRITF